ncbi:MAG: ATP synthase F0 subunit C [Candidatus Aminicenantales bacterium]
MSKKLKALSLLIFAVALMTLPVLAQGTIPATAPAQDRADLFKVSLIVGGAIITLAVIAGAFCQAKAISAGCEGISRNPAGAPHIRFLLLLGLVLIETLVIYALLITIIILMVKWGNYIPKV